MLENLMTRSVDWYRPVIGTGSNAAEYQKDATLMGQDIPVSIQPLSGRELEFHLLHGSEKTHSVYTATINDYQRNDYLMYGTRKLVLTGPPRDLIELGRVMVMDCTENPSVAKER